MSDAFGKHRPGKIEALKGTKKLRDFRLHSFFRNVGKNLADRFPTDCNLEPESSFIAPLPPLSFWSGTIRVVQSTTCLCVKPDCRLSWSEHVSQVRRSFAQKYFKRMKYFPVKTLQETSFKIIIPSLTYCIKSGKTALKPFFLLWT